MLVTKEKAPNEVGGLRPGRKIVTVSDSLFTNSQDPVNPQIHAAAKHRDDVLDEVARSGWPWSGKLSRLVDILQAQVEEGVSGASRN